MVNFPASWFRGNLADFEKQSEALREFLLRKAVSAGEETGNMISGGDRLEKTWQDVHGKSKPKSPRNEMGFTRFTSWIYHDFWGISNEMNIHDLPWNQVYILDFTMDFVTGDISSMKWFSPALDSQWNEYNPWLFQNTMLGSTGFMDKPFFCMVNPKAPTGLAKNVMATVVNPIINVAIIPSLTTINYA